MCYIVTKCDGVTVRARPSTKESKILGILPAGAELPADCFITAGDDYSDCNANSYWWIRVYYLDHAVSTYIPHACVNWYATPTTLQNTSERKPTIPPMPEPEPEPPDTDEQTSNNRLPT
jgi:hypothetical protein